MGNEKLFEVIEKLIKKGYDVRLHQNQIIVIESYRSEVNECKFTEKVIYKLEGTHNYFEAKSINPRNRLIADLSNLLKKDGE